MRPTAAPSAYRRKHRVLPPRLVRALRGFDIYLLLAFFGVIAYIIIFCLLAAGTSNALGAYVQTSQVETNADGAPTGGPTLIDSVDIKDLTRNALAYVKQATQVTWELTESLPRVRLHLADLKVLVSYMGGEAEELHAILLNTERRHEQNMVNEDGQGDTEGWSASEVVEALRGLLTTFRVLHMDSEVEKAASLLSLYLNARPSLPNEAGLGDEEFNSWAAVGATSVTQVLSIMVSLKENTAATAAERSALCSKTTAWQLLQRRTGAASTLPHVGLITAKLQQATGPEASLEPGFASIENGALAVYESLLLAWECSGKREMPFVEMYDVAIEGILSHLVRSTVGEVTGSAGNFTFAGYLGSGALFPMLTPAVSCALPGLLARGSTAGAHGYAGRPNTRRFTDNDIFEAAEALAASCMRLYLNVDLMHDGPASGTLVVGQSGRSLWRHVQHPASPPPSTRRQPACDLLLVMLQTLSKLYDNAKDPIYGLWAMQLMSAEAEGSVLNRCALGTVDALRDEARWLRYIQEMRHFALLFLKIDCDQNGDSRGRRWICHLPRKAILSPDGHAIMLKG